MKIRLLDKATIDKIAAGEVVERPANVVKELMENSIDSGASAVSVEIKDGGKTFIRVTDNGCGIEKDQVRTAFLRHATSKISTADDLSFVTTLGFRGEALSSIAAVSETELLTKTASDITGTIYKIASGVETEFSEAGLPNGTTIIISNLFKNVPARLKFLATSISEGNTITDAVEKIALSHPDIAIKFTNNGAVRLNTSGNGSLKDVIYAIYGRELTSNLLEVHYSDDLLTVSGFIGKPEIQRANRAYENFFVNGRFVKDKILSSAVENAYKGFVMKGSYPFTALNIKIEPELMDVNVHPSKKEIRFFNNEAVYTSLYNCVSNIINSRENIPEFNIETKEDIKIQKDADKIESRLLRTPSPEPFEEVRKSSLQPGNSAACTLYDNKVSNISSVNEDVQNAFVFNESGKAAASETLLKSECADADNTAGNNIISHKLPAERENTGTEELNVAYEQQTLFTDGFLSEKARAKHKVIGEVFSTYWIVEYDDKMFIIDQHAAHEKILYERFMKMIKASLFPSQMIMPPLVVTLSAAEESVLLSNIDSFNRLGFETEHFGGSEYIISSVPSGLYGLNNAALFTSFLDELADSPVSVASEMLDERIATAACKAAVKGGDELSYEEADALIDELLSLDNPYNCPHGRPTIITMSKHEMEKKFKRII